MENTSNSSQQTIAEAIRKIALGRSMERINMAPGGTSGVGTARMIHDMSPKCMTIRVMGSTRSMREQLT